MVSPFGVGQEVLETVRKTASAEIEAADTDVLFKKLELAKKYAAALDTLEKKLAAEGDLDAIVRLREEKETVETSGDTTAHGDKPLVELREKYITARNAIEKEMDGARAKAAEGIAAKLREEEAALVKAGKVDEALALRQQGERLILELGGGAAADIPFADDPRSTATTDLKPLAEIKIPEDQPPVFEKPFAIKGRWLESMTMPVARQRIREQITIGDRAKKSWPTVVVPPGSMWAGNDTRIEISAGNLLASKSKFSNLKIEPDLASSVYFLNCLFDDCGFYKGGVWYGSDYAAKFYLENCLIRKRFCSWINQVDHGFRIESSVFENLDLPQVNFRSKQPADLVNERWLRFVNCRFVKCTVPSSFLLLTRDCVFENCIFIDSERQKDEAEITKPIEVVLYVEDCKSRISKLPEQVTLTEKPVSELKVTIPTAESLTALIDR